MADMGKAFPTTNGVWSATTQYERLCIVTYNGSSYISTNSTINDVPNNSSNWQLIAQKGDIGSTGIKGQDAPLGYLNGAAQPINQWNPFWSNTGLNDDGTGTAVGSKPGCSYDVYHRENWGNAPFDRMVRLFDAKNDDVIRFFWYKENAAVAMGSATKTVGSDGKVFDLDTIVPKEAENCAVEYSRGVTGHIAVYSRYVDSYDYYPVTSKANSSFTEYNAFSPFSGSVDVEQKNGLWFVNGYVGSLTVGMGKTLICELPFSLNGLHTYLEPTDSGGFVTLLIDGSSLFMYNTSNAQGGAVRLKLVIDADLINR